MSKIRNFYKGKSILVTGATGFIGKVLIEKILYSCSEVKQIFLIIRLNKNQKLKERFDNLLNSPVFTRIKNEKSEVLEKLTPIEGNIELCDFGISNENLVKIIHETEIIFNVAGLVNFLEPIQTAFICNTVSFKNLIEIAKRMKNLQVLMHVSTGFCFRQRENIQV
jgi:alcohol-forming fatty acyl-CoA reductase